MTSGSSSPRVLQFHRASAQPHAIESVERNGYAADIFHNPELQPPTWHFILTRLDDPEVLYWGQEPSLQRARDAARNLLAAMAADMSFG